MKKTIKKADNKLICIKRGSCVASPGKEILMETKACRCMGCGAPLPIEDEDDGVITCEYCGMINYVPELDEEEPVYTELPKTGKEVIGRFFEMKEEKQENITLTIIIVVIFSGMMLALIAGAISGSI